MLPRRLPTPSWVFVLQFGEEPKPGDLIQIFRIGYEHWAIYVGNGRIVHASNERNGIIESNWNYRTPVAIKNVIGE